MNTFKQLAENITNTSPAHFLALVKEQSLQDLTSYFIFNNLKNETSFFQSLEFLADNTVWTKEELSSYTFIAQTIDNDFILASDDKTLVIPYSCYKSDSEIFDFTIFEFFSKQEQGLLNSMIIPK